jgi:hypothetical protein
MAAENDNGERKRSHWGPIIATFVGLAVPGLIAWGVTQGQVSAHTKDLAKQDQRLDAIENTFVRERDLTAMSVQLNDRLRRIETQLDQLLQRQMRPAP